MTQQMQIGRLKMRKEGPMWNAYYALPADATQQPPIFLGSINLTAVVEDEERMQAFMEMMRDIVSDIIEQKTGVRPTWGGPIPAPEHERSGEA